MSKHFKMFAANKQQLNFTAEISSKITQITLEDFFSFLARSGPNRHPCNWLPTTMNGQPSKGRPRTSHRMWWLTHRLRISTTANHMQANASYAIFSRSGNINGERGKTVSLIIIAITFSTAHKLFCTY